MGCSYSKVESGLIVPEEELIISRNEKNHPLALIDISNLTFPSEPMTDFEFYDWCSTYNIPSKFFSGKNQLFFNAIRNSSNMIDSKKLIFASILLSNGNFQKKLKTLTSCFSINSKKDANKIINGLILTASDILPLIGLTDSSYMNLNCYIDRIKAAERSLSARFVSKFKGKYDSESFQDIFCKNPDLKMIFWPNGIRMLLIEDEMKMRLDLENTMDKSYQGDLLRKISDRKKIDFQSLDSTRNSRSIVCCKKCFD